MLFPTDQSGCQLLKLPAELRNRICEYATVDEDPIQVSTSLKQAPLTKTCRQLRKESLSLWYFSNKFEVPVTNCDGELLILWVKHVNRVKRFYEWREASVEFTWCVRGMPNWANLKKWDLELWKRKTDFKPARFDGRKGGNVGAMNLIDAAHNIAHRMLHAEQSAVEEALEDLRYAVLPFTDMWN